MNIHATCLLMGERSTEDLLVTWHGWRRVLAGVGLLLYAAARTLPAIGIYQGRYS